MKMIARVSLFAGFAGVAFGVAACGGGNSNPSATTAPQTTPVRSAASATVPGTAPAGGVSSPAARVKDPCGYVTVAQVQTATGKTVTGEAVRVNDFACRYQTGDGGVINTTVSSPVEKTRFEQAAQANIGSGTLAKIAGLGDEAFAVNFGVAVLKNQTAITVEVSPGPPTGGDGAIALARLLVERN